MQKLLQDTKDEIDDDDENSNRKKSNRLLQKLLMEDEDEEPEEAEANASANHAVRKSLKSKFCLARLCNLFSVDAVIV